MRKGLTVVIILVVVAVIGYMVTGGPGRKGVTALDDQEQIKTLTVEAIEVARGNVKQVTELNVTYLPYSSVAIIPKAAGTVQEVLVATGEQVKKDQILFVIDDTQSRLQVKQAEAAYEMAKANLAQVEKGASAEELKQIESTVLQAKASYENADAEYKRMEELDKKEMISKKQLEAVELQKKIAEANLAAAEARLTAVQKGASEEQLNVLRAQVKQAKTALEMANLQLSYARVKAPISGIVAQLNVEKGSMAAPSSPAGVILDSSKMKAKAMVPESYINNLKVGEKVTLEAKALPKEIFTGTITAISPLADQLTKQFPVEFMVGNSSNLLKAGMFGTAYLAIGEARDLPVVPISTVLFDGEQPYVFVIEDGRAQRREIKTGLNSGKSLAVLDGLMAGEIVISKGQHQVKNGMLVEVK
jgi:multidrug resistance efflux pump